MDFKHTGSFPALVDAGEKVLVWVAGDLIHSYLHLLSSVQLS